jgi:sulfate transport system permease protein
VQRSALPGLPLTLGLTIFYLSLVICLPIATLVAKAADLGLDRYLAVVSSPRAVAAFEVTFLCALGATAFNALFGLAMAWVLVRHEFPGRRVLDALVDLPFALPTAVAGLALTALFAKNGWFGAPLAAIGLPVACTAWATR